MNVIDQLTKQTNAQRQSTYVEYVRFLDSGNTNVKKLQSLLLALNKTPDDAKSDLATIHAIRRLRAIASDLDSAQERLDNAEERHLDACAKRQVGIKKLNDAVAESMNAQEIARGELSACHDAKRQLRDYPSELKDLLH